MEDYEIPEAIRENIELPKKSALALNLPVILGIVFCLGLGGILSMFFLVSRPKSTPKVVEQPATKPVAPNPEIKPNQPAANQTNRKINQASTKKKDLLGHLPYDIAPKSSLEPITADGRLLMRASAAQKFKQMQADARAEGIILTAISAFRTAEDQEKLFFDIKEQRVQDAKERAEVSAPPGYSEHHTGYAVDIGDGNVPSTHVEVEFADTPAFAWLEKNALKYSFELSFPRDNEQDISYEPWHWRFVGDRDSLETFYKVRN